MRDDLLSLLSSLSLSFLLSVFRWTLEGLKGRSCLSFFSFFFPWSFPIRRTSVWGFWGDDEVYTLTKRSWERGVRCVARWFFFFVFLSPDGWLTGKDWMWMDSCVWWDESERSSLLSSQSPFLPFHSFFLREWMKLFLFQNEDGKGRQGEERKKGKREYKELSVLR